MITEITYYDPRRKVKKTEQFDEDWRVDAFVHKLRREGKRVVDVRKKNNPVEPIEPQENADEPVPT